MAAMATSLRFLCLRELLLFGHLLRHHAAIGLDVSRGGNHVANLEAGALPAAEGGLLIRHHDIGAHGEHKRRARARQRTNAARD
jgi:hypothetical protein